MRVLVTGAAGFLGSHLCDYLLDSGYQVVGIDNLFTGNLSNLCNATKHKNFTFEEWDVNIPFDYRVEGIFNLASPASPVHYQKNPVETIRTNFLGSLNCLNLAHRNSAVVLQASTSEVYGDPTISPQTETYWGNVNPIGPRSCYDEGKRSAESLFFDFHRQFGTRIKVARIFNTYGPRMAFDDGRVVSNFVTQALRNKPITMYGSGKQTRSFCYVDDLIRGLVAMFESEVATTGPINLGNPQEINMLELADKILKLTNSKSQLVEAPLPQDDPTIRCPDITLASELLKWQPEFDLTTGLNLTIEDFKNRQLKESIN